MCKICEGPFKDQKEYDKHFNSHSKKSGHHDSLNCEKCNKEFKKQKQLTVHLWRHLGIFSCRDCDKRFSSLSGLKLHGQKNHSNKDDFELEMVKSKKFTCDLCQKGFSKKVT